MKAALLALSAALLPAFASAQAPAPSPYVETTTLNFYWGFTLGYVTNTTDGIPALPEIATTDPDTLPDGSEVYTDTVVLRAYTGPIAGSFAPAGANQQIIQMLLQRMVREGRLSSLALGYRWQIIGVREAPANVAELASNPYRIFLSVQRSTSDAATSYPAFDYGPELIDDAPAPEDIPFSTPIIENIDGEDVIVGVNVDTGITLTLGAYSGNYTETNWGPANNKVRNASGNVTTAFTVNFGAVFFEDPKHSVDKPENDPRFNYHLERNFWRAQASGFITYNIRSTRPPFATFMATNSKATATGWFYHQRDEYEYKDDVLTLVGDADKTYSFGGIAPLRVTMSTIQYQKRDRFPALAN